MATYVQTTCDVCGATLEAHAQHIDPGNLPKDWVTLKDRDLPFSVKILRDVCLPCAAKLIECLIWKLDTSDAEDGTFHSQNINDIIERVTRERIEDD